MTMPNDVKAMADFYTAMKDEPYQAQSAAVQWLASRFDADHRRMHPLSEAIGRFAAQEGRGPMLKSPGALDGRDR